MNEIKLALDFFKWLLLSLFVVIIFVKYIDHLEAKDIRHTKLCEKLDCVNPRIGGPPGGGK